jgi:hypothetical protein
VTSDEWAELLLHEFDLAGTVNSKEDFQTIKMAVDQIVKAERERAAKIVEEAPCASSHYEIAAKIRGGE